MERVFKGLRIAAPALAVGLAILFGPMALFDLRVEDFRDATLPAWVPSLTASLEALAAILLLVPAARAFAATTLAALMVLAVGVRLAEGAPPALPLLLLAAAACVAFVSMQERREA